MDFSFLYTYKGTLYPLQLPDSPVTQVPVTSLVDLACAQLVKDATSTHQAVQCIPAELCYNLLKAALLNTRDRTIEVLVSAWPAPVLRLASFVPPMFEELGALFNDRYLSDQMRRGVKYTTCLAHTFVECLKKRAPTKLRCLDLTGFPSAEVIVNYLSSHVLLVYNEVRQREIITMYNEVTCRLPEEQRHSYMVDKTLPDDQSYVILVDAVLFTNDTHMELCRALKTSRILQCPFKLRLSKLDLSCFGVARITVLLEQVEPEFLTALCLQYNSILDEGLMILAPALQRLTSLTSLDLSSNNINLTKSDTAAILSQTLHSLPNLVRLDLSNNRTKNGLFRILSEVERPLHFLRLCGCGISQWDLTYLKNSHHASALRHVDLSENMLNARASELLYELAQAVAGTLEILELENCSLNETDCAGLFARCRAMQALRFLNLSRNDNLATDLILDNLGTFVDMARLDVLRMSFPRECYELADTDDAIETFKITLSHRITALLNTMCEKNGRRLIKFVLTQSNFDMS